MLNRSVQKMHRSNLWPLSGFIFVCVLALPGCAEWGAIKSSIATHSAQAADEELVTARWATCNAATAGALRRRYANDPVGLKAWQDFCSNQSEKAVAP